jgi:hypothetical protein
MFKLLYTNLAGPMGDINVSAGLVAEAGMIGLISANATTRDPEVVLYTSGVSTANRLVGIIDDQKTSSFSATVVAEVIVSGQTTLAHANVIAASDTSTLTCSGTALSATPTCTLTSRTNGTVTIGGVDPNDTGSTVSYSYVIPGKAGDDTTLASGKCTIWLQEGEYATDVYELAAVAGARITDYAVGNILYAADNVYGQAGRLTARNLGSAWGSKVVGFVTKAPTAGNPVMNFYKANV